MGAGEVTPETEYARISVELHKIRLQMPAPRRPKVEIQPSEIVYRDPNGNVWDGRGHAPKWIRDYEAGGLPRAVWRIAP